MNDMFWRGVLVFQIVLLLMLGAMYPVHDPGTPTYVITQLAALHVIAGIVIVSILLYVDWDPFESLR